MATTDDDQATLQLDSTVRKMMAGLAGAIEIPGEDTPGNAPDIRWATNLALDRLDNGLDPNYPPIALSSFMTRAPETL